MRLLVTEKGKTVNEFVFRTGPIYIGRQMGSQVFLPDRSVSRQHAVIYTSKSNQWLIEDLDSANKTFLNKHAIHKAEISNGDTIKIGNFNIKVTLQADQDTPKKPSIHLDDTIAGTPGDFHCQIRIPNSKDSPLIKIPPTRDRDYLNACRQLNNVRSIKFLHHQLIDILLSQFTPLNAFAALRKEDSGPMDIEAGRNISSRTVEQSDIIASDKIKEAIESRHYILVPKMPKCKIRSAIIAPILNGKKCHGYLYVNNSTMHEPYEMTDLDYLTLLSIHAAALMETV